MKIDGKPYRSIWDEDGVVHIIDQRRLPYEFRVQTLESLDDFATAIRDMWVRGAPLIGATAAYAMAFAAKLNPETDATNRAAAILAQTRPTAINLNWALDRCCAHLARHSLSDRPGSALTLARAIADEDVDINYNIGRHGLKILKTIAQNKNGPVNVLTHCNAGWLATVDWGTATSPIYQAHDAGLDIHVWVDETRPRNQGALTAWELSSHGVAHTYITDNAGGHLMQNGEVDIVITGTDRTTGSGDVANKIGTYLKALAAKDNNVPFYVALPSPTIDWTLGDGFSIPIENRPEAEVSQVQGTNETGITSVQVSPMGSAVANPAFDVTPARLVTGLITEKGVCQASREGLAGLFNR